MRCWILPVIAISLSLPILEPCQAAEDPPKKKPAAAFSEATALQNAGRFDSAIKSWKILIGDLIKNDPTNRRLPLARYNLTICLYTLASAKATAEAQAEDTAEARAARYGEASAEAEALLNDLPADSPQRIGCRRLAALSRLEQGRARSERMALEAALGHFQALEQEARGKPEAIEAGFLIGDALALLDRPQEAAARLSAWLIENPSDPLASDARYLLGRSCYRAGQYDRTVAVLKEFLATNPPRPRIAETHYLLGLASSKVPGLQAQALLELDEAIKTGHPKPDLVHFERGRQLLAQGKKQEAADAFARVAGIPGSSKSGDALYQAGLLRAEMGEHRIAVGHFESALEAKPEPARKAALLSAKALSESKLGSTREARTTCERLLLEFPEGDEACRTLVLLAGIGRTMNDPKLCQTSWERFSKINPDGRLLALLNAGEAALKAGDEKAAFQHLEVVRAEAAATHLAARAELDLGCHASAKGKLEEAAACFRRAEIIGQNTEAEAQAGLELGEILVRQRNLEAAVDQFIKSAGSHEAHADWSARAWFRAGTILEILSQDDQAIRCYEQVLRLQGKESKQQLSQASSKRLDELKGKPVSNSTHN
jgi:tetratricopeptide (TPR) repeat protein